MKKIVLFAICLLQASHLLSFIFSYYHLKKNSKQVFLLGDVHLGARPDNFEKDLILKMMAKSSDFAEPVTFICEANKEHLDETKKKDKGLANPAYPMIGTIREVYHSMPQEYETSKFHFVYADARRPNMMYAFAGNYSDIDMSELKKDITEAIKQVVSASRGLSSQLQMFINSTLQDVAIDNFYLDDEDLSRDEIIHNKKLLNLLTDLTFYVNVQKALLDSDKVILYAGANHNKRVFAWLKKDGFNVEEAKSYDFDLFESMMMMHPRVKDFMEELPYDITLLENEDWEKAFGTSLPHTRTDFFITHDG